MKIKKNDNVKVISGKDRGKSGKVIGVFPKSNSLVVEGINIRKKHSRSKKQGQKGQIIQKPMPLNASNVMIVDAKTGKRTRIGIKEIAGKNVRIAKKSGNEI